MLKLCIYLHSSFLWRDFTVFPAVCVTPFFPNIPKQMYPSDDVENLKKNIDISGKEYDNVIGIHNIVPLKVEDVVIRVIRLEKEKDRYYIVCCFFYLRTSLPQCLFRAHILYAYISWGHHRSSSGESFSSNVWYSRTVLPSHWSSVSFFFLFFFK